MDDDKLEHHALLPPALFEELLDLEDLRPQHVLAIVLTKIRSLKYDPKQTSAQAEESDDGGFIDISNQYLDDFKEIEEKNLIPTLPLMTQTRTMKRIFSAA